jgi:exonuclease III
MSTHLNRFWSVLCWNVRGLNAARKWDSVRNKVTEANCEIACFQETKKDSFDPAFIRKILPASFVTSSSLPLKVPLEVC